jgi:hypothetical protein
MSPTLKTLSEIAAKASDTFHAKHHDIDTLLGIMDKNLRQQGIPADAITIDCIMLDKKIVILIHDDKPDTVDIALGNKDGDIFSSSEQVLLTLSETALVTIMEENFIHH